MAIRAKTIDSLEEFVLSKCNSFVSMGIWPPGDKLRFKKWLSNFEKEEKELALYLLDGFSYYNMPMCISLMKASILNLSCPIDLPPSINEHKSKWRQTLADTIFIPVTGESRNVTDSGNIIAGYLRRQLSISQDNILTVDNMYDSAYKGQFQSAKQLVFFDDFLGSGSQFISMWENDFEKDADFLIAVRGRVDEFDLKTSYCGMIGTTYGFDRIQKAAPSVALHFSHIIKPQDSPLNKDCQIWPDHLKEDGPNFIHEVSKRAGIPGTKWKGYHDLGLTIAFDFTIPDATLPIFSWEENNWSPLMIKS